MAARRDTLPVFTGKTVSYQDGADVKIDHTGRGTSGLGAVMAGIFMGYQKIILCGIPLDDSGHYFDPPWVTSKFTTEVPQAAGELKWWNQLPEVHRKRIRSMSGRTREMFGAP